MRVARSTLIAALAAALTLAVACDGCGPPPLVASDLVITPASVGGRHRPRVVEVGGSLFVSGASGGLSLARVVSPGVLDLAIPVTGAGGFTSGTVAGSFQLTVSFPGVGAKKLVARFAGLEVV